jgi:hypothetical protein
MDKSAMGQRLTGRGVGFAMMTTFIPRDSARENINSIISQGILAILSTHLRLRLSYPLRNP